MKILMLSHRLPYPPTKGEKIRAWHHLRSLAPRHDVTLLSLVDDRSDLPHIEHLRQLATDVEAIPVARPRAILHSLAALPRAHPLSVRYCFSPALQRTLRARLSRERYDVVFVYSSAMAQYVDDSIQIPIVIDFVDMDSQKWLQYARHKPFPWSVLYRLEGQRMKAYERRIATRAAANLVVSRAEAALFRATAPGAPLAVLPLVIDTEYFSPGPRRVTPGTPTLIFTGVMDYFPNEDAVEYFARAILPRIRQGMPRVRFVIVGQRPSRRVRRLAAIAGIVVTGRVPDVRPYLADAHVAVAPFRLAQGMQTKILEAMAMAVPVVATSKAHEGLEATQGRELFVEDAPGSFANAVIRLLREPALQAQVGAAARSFVEGHHSGGALGAQLEQTLTGAALVEVVGGRP